MEGKLNLVIIGNVITIDNQHPRVKAVGIRGDKIVCIGTQKEVLKHVGKKTEILDLKDKTILPGFIDTHMHPLLTGITFMGVDLLGIRTIREVLDCIKKRVEVSSPGQWIEAFRFIDKRIIEQRYPTREELDNLSSVHPIIIFHNDLHFAMLNTQALKELKIDPTMDGICVEKNGQPTGYVEDPAVILLLESIQSHIDKHEQLNKITYAAHLESEAGATTVYMKEPLSVIRTIMENVDQLPVRIKPMVWISDINKDDELDKIFQDPVLKNQACICLICDGTFDGHTAATFEPYYDDPSTLGMLYHEEETLYRFMKKAHVGGHQLSAHTVSDRAIEQVLDTYERILREHPRPDHRHRFEHFELFTKAQLKRVSRLGLTVGIQPIFVPFCEGPDLEGYRRFIGEERVRRTNHFRSIIDEGILAAGGSDSPAAPLNHMKGIQACLTHPNKEARISLYEALRLYTLDAARIGFEENIKGSIKVGKLADFIVLDEDPFRMSPDTIGEIQVEMTILGGKIVNKL